MQKHFILQSVFFVVFALSTTTSFSQNTINVAGHSAVINGMKFDYSIGEMTLVTTQRNNNLIITQGLLQPTESGTADNQSGGGTSLTDMSDRIKVYPNPTENILFIETIETMDTEISYQLFDAAGKVLLSKEFVLKAGPNKFSIVLKSFAAGNYYLMLRKPGQDGKMENTSYKIQKID